MRGFVMGFLRNSVSIQVHYAGGGAGASFATRSYHRRELELGRCLADKDRILSKAQNSNAPLPCVSDHGPCSGVFTLLILFGPTTFLSLSLSLAL